MIQDELEPECTNPLKVLIVDDHPIVLSGCRSLLGPKRHIQLLEASTGKDALALFQQQRPDVVVIDINLPDTSGLDLSRQILNEAPEAKIIILSMNDDSTMIQEALRCRVKGYVSKNGDPAAIYAAIIRVARGGVWLPAELARQVAFLGAGSTPKPEPALAERDIQILRMLAAGDTMYEIANVLGVSYKTVANTCTVIREKLGARTAIEMMAIALDRKLI